MVVVEKVLVNIGICLRYTGRTGPRSPTSGTAEVNSSTSRMEIPTPRHPAPSIHYHRDHTRVHSRRVHNVALLITSRQYLRKATFGACVSSSLEYFQIALHHRSEPSADSVQFVQHVDLCNKVTSPPTKWKHKISIQYKLNRKVKDKLQHIT